MSSGSIQRPGTNPRQVQNAGAGNADSAPTQVPDFQKGIGTAADLGGPLQLSATANTDLRTSVAQPNPNQLQDSFSLGSAVPRPSNNAVDKAKTEALEKFQDRLVDVLGAASGRALTAEQMAMGKPMANGPVSGELTPAQQKELANAGKDLLMEMPISALSPSAAAYAKSYVQSRGGDVTDFESKTIKDLKPVASDLAKNLIRDMKSDSPAAFYGLAAAGAVAVGAYGYHQGSDSLKKLGIKPEVDSKLFNDKVRARAEASWGEKLKDPNLTLGADGTFRVSPTATLRVGASAKVGGPSLSDVGFKGTEARVAFERAGDVQFRAKGQITTDENFQITKGNAEARLTGTQGSLGFKMNYDRPSDALGYSLDGKYKTAGGLTLSGDANFDRRFEMERGRLGVSHTFTGAENHSLSVGMNSTFGRAGRFETIGAEAKYRSDAWRLSADVQHSVRDDRTTGSLSVGYEARKDLDFEIRGSLDTRGNSQIGAGLRWRF